VTRFCNFSRLIYSPSQFLARCCFRQIKNDVLISLSLLNYHFNNLFVHFFYSDNRGGNFSNRGDGGGFRGRGGNFSSRSTRDDQDQVKPWDINPELVPKGRYYFEVSRGHFYSGRWRRLKFESIVILFELSRDHPFPGEGTDCDLKLCSYYFKISQGHSILGNNKLCSLSWL